MCLIIIIFFVFFFNDTATTEIYTLSLHDALPISQVAVGAVRQTMIDVAGGPPPLPIEERPVTAQDVSFMDIFVPGILAMSLMNSGVIGLATAFVTYRERGILRRIRVT